MAALQQLAHVAAAADRDKASATPALPNGRCTYGDPVLGSCGCNRFWDKSSAELHQGSVDHRTHSQRSTWCVCTHHACYHLYNARLAPETTRDYAIPAQARAHSACDGRCQLQAGSQCGIHTGSKDAGPGPVRQSGSPALYTGHVRTSQPALTNEDPAQHALPPPNGAMSNYDMGRHVLQLNASSLPSIPSVCLLSEDRPHKDRAVATGTTIGPVGIDGNAANQPLAGLGLSLFDSPTRRQSVTSAILEEMNRFRSWKDVDLPSTRANSIREDSVRRTPPPPGGPLDQVLEFNRTLRLNVESDTVPNIVDPEDFIQSATEVATPSNANTPDLGPVDQAVLETKTLIDTLTRLASPPDRRTAQSPRPACATSNPAVPTPSQDELQQAIKTSPQVLQKLVSYLKPLHNLLNSIPNISNSMRDFSHRLDRLESHSFSQMPVEDFQQQLELHDGRLLELEHRMDDHEALHESLDDQSSHSNSRRALGGVDDSFGSNQSIQSASSALVVSIPSKEMQAEVEGIKDRLDVLEAAAMPSMANPWEVEVVLLPWGPHLRGIWFAPDVPMHDTANPVTQDSEDWTQGLHTAQNARSSQVPSAHSRSGPGSNGKVSLTSSLNLSEAESGWSSQAISNWAAGDVDEWLSPKACASTNLVYKRLQSRGFVKHVTLTSASATDIQKTLSSAFVHLFDHLRFTEGDEDTVVHAFPGLRAPFIPLRKVRKESRLRFLTRAEMSTPALWSAQFLSSGVMMRVPGGKKRLYVTQRESYLQQNDGMDYLALDEVIPQKAWTWQDIRQLPRFQEPGTDSQMEGNDEPCQREVPEADAKEACWAFVETYDLPPASVTSSFNSHQSAPIELSMRPAGQNWRRSMTPSSILKNRQPQPISPLSENPPLRTGHRRLRTCSSSVIEQAPLSSGKRRLNSSPVKQSSDPHISARPASIVDSRPKRRRVASSSYPEANPPTALEQEGQVQLWNNNSSTVQRRPGELPSPFYSSQHPELARTSSDLTRGSQRSSALARRATPSAYATPYSGPVGGGYYGYSDDGPGDTEPDDDYQDNGDADSDSDGEQSWRGVDDGEDAGQITVNNVSDMSSNSSSSGSSSGLASDAEGDDSGFGSEHSDNDSDDADEADGDDDDDDAIEDDNDDEDAFDFGSQRPSASFREDADDDDDDDVFNAMLRVIEE